jgi:hypothetical protein
MREDAALVLRELLHRESSLLVHCCSTRSGDRRNFVRTHLQSVSASWSVASTDESEALTHSPREPGK